MTRKIRALNATIQYYKKEAETARELGLPELTKAYLRIVCDCEEELEKLRSD